MRGSLVYHFKYDLGGSIERFDAFCKVVQKKAGDGDRRLDDVTVYNFNYLSTIDAPFSLPESSIEIEGVRATQRVSITSKGVLSIELWFAPFEDDTVQVLEDRLLQLHNKVIQDKNRDYQLDLARQGQMTGALRERALPDRSGVINFGPMVERMRKVARPYLRPRPLYSFHDFRTIFVLEDVDQFGDRAINSLLSLTKNEEVEVSFKHQSIWGQRIFGKSWAFVLEEGAHTSEILHLFDDIHSHWFIAQIWSHEVRRLDGEVVRAGHQLFRGRRREVTRQLNDVRIKKNEIFSELVSVLNVDFIAKNGEFTQLISFLQAQFNLTDQIHLLERYTDRLSNFLADAYDQLSQRRADAAEANARTLEFLFLINAIAGIAGLSTTFFASDVSADFQLDAARLLAFGLIAASVGLYVLFRISRSVLNIFKR